MNIRALPSIVFLLTPSFLAAQTATRVALRDVTVVDVSDGSLSPGQTVLIKGDRIRAVGPSSSVTIPSNAEVLDGTGRFVIPGLWDMHTHTLNRWSWAFPLHVANGITGIRDASTSVPMSQLLRLRADVAAGRVIGPRFLTGGPLIDGPESVHPYISVNTPADARAKVDSLQREGVDFIKVYDKLSPPSFFAIIEAARPHGLSVVGHLPVALPQREAIAAGMKSVEHSHSLGYLCIGDGAQETIARMGSQAEQAMRLGDTLALRQLEMMADSIARAGHNPASCASAFKDGTWITPTLTLHIQSMLQPATLPADSLFANRQYQYVPVEWRDNWRVRRAEAVAEDAAIDSVKRRLWRASEIRHTLRQVGDVHRNGGKILAGTDGSWYFQVFGFNLHEELEWLVKAGLTPLAALQAATINPAQFLGKDSDMGTVASGKFADLVILDANPITDITNTKRVHAVVLNGRLLRRSILDSLLASVASVHARRE